MNTNYLILSIIFIQFFFNGCDNSTEPVNKDGTISGEITIGEYNRAPSQVLQIKLYKENGNQQLVDSILVQNGKFTINELPDGLLVFVLPKITTTLLLEIGSLVMGFVKIMKSNLPAKLIV